MGRIHDHNHSKKGGLTKQMEEIIQTKEDSIKLIRNKEGKYSWTITIGGDLDKACNELKKHDTNLKKLFN